MRKHYFTRCRTSCPTYISQIPGEVRSCMNCYGLPAWFENLKPLAGSLSAANDVGVPQINGKAGWMNQLNCKTKHITLEHYEDNTVPVMQHLMNIAAPKQ